jgi:predicted Zn-dependent protease with MMP-like domain
MRKVEFEKLVRDALKSLPKEIKDRLRNVDVVIEVGTGKEDCTGLYEGVPLDRRTGEYSMALPDKITIFRRAVEAEYRRNGADIKKEIRHLVRHEIAHHLGISDERLIELGIY